MCSLCCVLFFSYYRSYVCCLSSLVLHVGVQPSICGGRGFKKLSDDVMRSASAAVNHLLTPPTSPSTMSSSFEKEGGAVASPPSLYDHTPQSIPPLAPPLPPPPPVRNPAGRKRRVRSFYWKPIPEDRVKQQNGPNLWSSRDPFHIDISAIEELFGHEDTPSFTASSDVIGRRHASVRHLRPQVSHKT